jgi:hypothetical protein
MDPDLRRIRMGRLKNDSASSNDDRELSITNLTQIKGIARTTAEAMYEIGIHSYADLIEYLSQHTAEEFSEALKEHGVTRPPGLIDREAWIRAAEKLNKGAPTPPKGEAEPVEEPKEQPSREHDAVFTVSFDVTRDEAEEPVLNTTVYDEGNGGKEETFQGTDTSLWISWMLERANLPFVIKPITAEVEATGEELPPTKAEAAIPSIPGELYDFLLEIDDVQLSEIGPMLEIPEKSLKAEIKIKLSGSDAEKLSLQGTSFRTEIYTIDLDSGYPRQVGSKEDQFEPHIFEYTHQIGFTMPDVGRYEFHNLVRLLPSGELRASHRGPTMRIVP